ncbi:hypothetical protein [Candidatus Enterococcus lemimoniae]|uniref:Uncharacterized protein n=1 Tax=Candidatus Enterococcus lemimoniae TaxID=1834167 RepID=A0ABZ2T7N4_9ENTE
MGKIIQFIHGGKDNSEVVEGVANWTKLKSNHNRKLLKYRGNYISNLKNLEAKIESGKDKELLFWAEWEPPTSVERVSRSRNQIFSGDQNRDKIKYLHTPTPVPKIKKTNCKYQNTDPYVLGKRFFYSNCLQKTKGKGIGLHDLNRGDIILFGSRHSEKFYVDTVFVVGNRECVYTKKDIGKRIEATSGVFKTTVTDRVLSISDRDSKWTLYSAAMFNDSNEDINNMFSFFPCRLADSAQNFSDIKLDFNDEKFELTSNLSQSFKVIKKENMFDYWQTMVEETFRQNLLLGWCSDEPPLSDDLKYL